MAVRPFGSQRGQQPNFLALTLQQHFRERGGRAEISVNLEPRIFVRQPRLKVVADEPFQLGRRSNNSNTEKLIMKVNELSMTVCNQAKADQRPIY